MIRAASLHVATVGQVLICRACGARATVRTAFEVPMLHADGCPFIAAVEGGEKALVAYIWSHGDPMLIVTPEAN